MTEHKAVAAAVPVVGWFPILTVITGALVLLQAVLAGRGLFFDYDLIEVHGYVGNATFIAAMLLVVGAWLGRQRGSMGMAELALSLGLLVLTVAQIGLGYGGREDQLSASLHIPNGILVTGLCAALITLAYSRRPRRT